MGGTWSYLKCFDQLTKFVLNEVITLIIKDEIFIIHRTKFSPQLRSVSLPSRNKQCVLKLFQGKLVCDLASSLALQMLRNILLTTEPGFITVIRVNSIYLGQYL